jgi:hypothetical protein
MHHWIDNFVHLIMAFPGLFTISFSDIRSGFYHDGGLRFIPLRPVENEMVSSCSNDSWDVDVSCRPGALVD